MQSCKSDILKTAKIMNGKWQYYLSPHQCQHVAEVLPQFMITCAKEVMFSLYLFVCVFVSQQYYVKTT